MTFVAKPRLHHLPFPFGQSFEELPDSSAAVPRVGGHFLLLRPRTGEKSKNLEEILDLTTRAAHEQELFPPADWDFIEWLAEWGREVRRRHLRCRRSGEAEYRHP